jgi:hypothetical protein
MLRPVASELKANGVQPARTKLVILLGLDGEGDFTFVDTAGTEVCNSLPLGGAVSHQVAS